MDIVSAPRLHLPDAPTCLRPTTCLRCSLLLLGLAHLEPSVSAYASLLLFSIILQDVHITGRKVEASPRLLLLSVPVVLPITRLRLYYVHESVASIFFSYSLFVSPCLSPESLSTRVHALTHAGPPPMQCLTARVPHPLGDGRIAADCRVVSSGNSQTRTFLCALRASSPHRYRYMEHRAL